MSDESIATRIERLVAEEHELREDLLRQRRALRRAGGNAGDATVRDEETVEGYLQ
jgi:hypothetical protein